GGGGGVSARWRRAGTKSRCGRSRFSKWRAGRSRRMTSISLRWLRASLVQGIPEGRSPLGVLNRVGRRLKWGGGGNRGGSRRLRPLPLKGGGRRAELAGWD